MEITQTARVYVKYGETLAFGLCNDYGEENERIGLFTSYEELATYCRENGIHCVDLEPEEKDILTVYQYELRQKMPEDKRIDGALAVTVANHGMVNGCFDYDLSDGEVMFRLTTAFHDTILSEEVYRYMILVAASTVDRYNDRFLMLAKGKSDIKQFIEEEND